MKKQSIFENTFKGLKRLFASDVIIRKIGNNKFKVIDTYNSQAMGSLTTNYLSNKFTSFFSSTYGNYGGYIQNYSGYAPIQRPLLFREYELMDQDPIIASALDLYAEESTIKNENGKIVSIKTEDNQIKSILDNLFYSILNIDFNLLHWTRNLVKYGDMFLKLDLAEKIGIVRVVPISPYYVERLENPTPNNESNVKFKVEGPVLKGTYEDYEISHFRLLSDSNYLPYGKSMVEPARRIWKQLTLMEDAMLIHRIIRAPLKRVFKIDVGNLSPDDAKFFMKNVSDQIKKVPYVDEQTGEYNLQYNITNLTEDFFIPTRGGVESTQIDTLPGLEYNAIEDVEYLKSKMLAALRIPKAFIGFDESISSKSTLSQEDIRFAKTIERIQKIIAAELKNLAIIHLYLQGFNEEDLTNFELYLNSPSVIYEQEKLEIWKGKLEISSQVKEQNVLGSTFIYQKFFGLSDSEIKKYKEDIIEDAKFEYRLSQIKEQGNDPAVSKEHVANGGTVRPVNHPDKTIVTGKELGSNRLKPGATMGRPPETHTTYGTDLHHLGRDPLGQTAVHKATDIDKNESIYTLINKLKPLKSTILNEKVSNSDIFNIDDKDMLTGSLENILND